MGGDLGASTMLATSGVGARARGAGIVGVGS